MTHIPQMKFAAALVLILTAAPALAKSDAQAAIEAQNTVLTAAVAKGDAAAVAALYTKKAEAMPPNARIAKGRKAIRKLWQGEFDIGLKDIKLTTIEVDELGDHADEEGQYAVIGKDGKVVDTGKYIVIWKREDGVWHLHRDIWNSNAPMTSKQ